MTTTKVEFKKRVPTVLKIIKEAKRPLGYTELYKELVKETGVNISKRTFSKCLKYLLSTLEIVKTEEKGKGNPVTYSLNKDDFIYKLDERVEFNCYWLERLADDYSPYGTEAQLWTVLAREISNISTSLLAALMSYSERDDRYWALNDYLSTIEIEILPHMQILHKLVKPPIKLNPSTAYLLFKLFNDDILDSIEKPLHPFMRVTRKQEKEIDILVNEKMAKEGVTLIDEFPCNIDLTHIENSNCVKEEVYIRKAKSQAFFETAVKENKNIKQNREMMSKMISGDVEEGKKNPELGEEFNEFIKIIDIFGEEYLEPTV